MCQKLLTDMLEAVVKGIQTRAIEEQILRKMDDYHKEVIKEVRKGECSTWIAFSLALAVAGSGLFVSSQPSLENFPMRYFVLILIGFVWAVYSYSRWIKLNRS